MCNCKTLKGTQCKNKAISGSLFCGRHQNCVAPVAVVKATKASPKRKAKTAKKVGKKTAKKISLPKKNYITGSKDTDLLLLRTLPPDELRRVCNLNKSLQKLCKENIQIRNRLTAEDPNIAVKIRRSLMKLAPYQIKILAVINNNKTIQVSVLIHRDAYADIDDLIMEKIKNIVGNRKIEIKQEYRDIKQDEDYRDKYTIIIKK